MVYEGVFIDLRKNSISQQNIMGRIIIGKRNDRCARLSYEMLLIELYSFKSKSKGPYFNWCH
jgi:hypothetical protein